MERFDVAFANRYFAALNGYFYPDKHPKPTHDGRSHSMRQAAVSQSSCNTCSVG